ncbi:hypothetical protein E8E13_005864 [Curvularia kusanoi]|uniref:Transcription factor domain-containing protein n=1 Tax=Curvularia kusanoi TaxID=90978 RepID=A0A9P4TN68_CURKU|nr:hypothetical protein E8E13_005864 [Curvularia kusanoi]
MTKLAYQSLPQSAFRSLQKSVFPVYFQGQTLLLALVVCTLPPHGPQSLVGSRTYMVTFAVAGGTALLNLLIFGPKTQRLMIERVHQATQHSKHNTNADVVASEKKELDRAFSQIPEQPSETPAEQFGENHDAADRHYIEQIRSIHRFGDPADHAQYPEGIFRPSRQREEPIKDDIVDGLLASGEADVLLKEYRKMSESFPFVPLAPDMTAQRLYNDSPMLFLAMMTAASWREHTRQMSLDAVFRQELAHRTIIRPRRNLGLVQGVLVYLSWYHFVFSHKTQQIFFLHHLVIGLAIDIGLHRDFQPLFFPHTQKMQDLDSKAKRERKRAFLGCYYLSSMVAAALQKPNLLKHNPEMTGWAQELKEYREFATDEVLGHLISLRQLDDEVQDTLFIGAGAEARLTDARVVIHVRFLETRLEAWRRDSEGSACKRMLLLSHAYTDMLLHTIALRTPLETAPSPPNDGSLIRPLLSALEAAKRFLDALLSCPASEYNLISFPEWMRLPSVMMTVAKLCIPSDAHTAAGWDPIAAQDLVRLDICLEALCYRFQNQSTHDKVTQPHPDFWWAMRLVTDLTRTWYVRKISAGVQEDSSSRPTPNQSNANTLLSVHSGALPTPPDGRAQSHFADFGNMDFSSMDMCPGIDGDGGHDPFAFMKSADFDMEQFFDMGIWGDEAYYGMGLGGGSDPF